MSAQQQEMPPTDGEQTQEPEWALASYGQRVGAWALDSAGFALPLILLIVGLAAIFIGLVFVTHEASGTVEIVDPTTGNVTVEERVIKSVTEFAGNEISDSAADTIAIALVVATVAVVIIWVGYIIWWLFALRRGQTPGKQIVGIRVIRDDGTPSSWGYTFLREFVIKFVLVSILSNLTMGAAWLVDYLWPLWDREKKMQTLHDKLLGTLVVRSR